MHPTWCAQNSDLPEVPVSDSKTALPGLWGEGDAQDAQDKLQESLPHTWACSNAVKILTLFCLPRPIVVIAAAVSLTCMHISLLQNTERIPSAPWQHHSPSYSAAIKGPSCDLPGFCPVQPCWPGSAQQRPAPARPLSLLAKSGLALQCPALDSQLNSPREVVSVHEFQKDSCMPAHACTYGCKETEANSDIWHMHPTGQW